MVALLRKIGVARLAAVLLVAFVWSGGEAPLRAQNRMGGRLLDPTRANPIQQWQQRAAESELLGLIALEGALDPAAYVVGPGDVFSVSTGGMNPVLVAVPVSADGNLVLPEAGGIPAAGRTLEVVQREAIDALRDRYQNVQVEVSLTLPRQFYVHITGAVPEPGRYLTQPLARVDDALQQAFAAQVRAQPDPTADGAPRIVGSATAQRPAFNQDFRPALRNVRVTHRDGTQQTLDLIRYYTTGDTRDNPYLLDGDVVTVPSYHQQHDGVRVSGEVAFPGTFDFRPGDAALDLLTLAAGPNAIAAIKQVRLTRRAPGGETQTRLLDVAALAAGEAVPLQPGDHLNVLPQEIAQAAINGLVAYPGTYRIEEGKTTLRELVEIAGGLQPEADLNAAFLERRKSMAFKEDGHTSDLDFFSRAYLRSSNSANRVIANIAAALDEGGPDIVLYDEDRVVFPRDEGTVFVTGNVPQPGYVAFVEGRTAGYYIAQAGGQGALSKGVYVFEDGTGRMRKGEQSIVREGDTVFVNREDIAESPEIAALLLSDRASKRQSRILTTQTIITGISAITGIITAFVAVRSLGN